MSEQAIDVIQRDPRNKQLTGHVEDTPWCDKCGEFCKYSYSAQYREREGQESLILRTICRSCYDEEERQRYVETGEMTGHLTLLASLHEARREHGEQEEEDPVFKQINDSVKRLEPYIRLFEDEVWFDYLAEKVRNAELKGQLADHETIDFYAWACAGRVIFTMSVKGEGSYISLITAESSNRRGTMGINGMYATFEVARDLLKGVLRAHEEGQLNVNEDRDVTILL